MADETIYIYDDQVTLESSGASAASDGFVAADDTSLSSANHSNYPLADAVLSCDFGAAVSSISVVNLFRQDLNIDGSNDAPTPASGYEHFCVGGFVIPSGTSATGYYPLNDIPLTKECQFSIQNKSNQDLSAGWTLKITPKTYGPAT